jgi:threonine/homoserine/homoserine lactone efflux protein
MLAFLTRGISLGFAAGVLPGPLQSYIIGTTLAQGWQRGIVIIFSPLLVDIPIILLVVFIMQQLPAGFVRVVQVAGGLFLLWLAREVWLGVRAGGGVGAAGVAETSLRAVFARALLMNALSPGPYLFWCTVNGPLLAQALEQSTLHAAAFLTGFYGCFLFMLALTVLLFDRVRRLSPRVTRAILLLTVMILVVFGITLIFGIDV